MDPPRHFKSLEPLRLRDFLDTFLKYCRKLVVAKFRRAIPGTVLDATADRYPRNLSLNISGIPRSTLFPNLDCKSFRIEQNLIHINNNMLVCGMMSPL